MKCPLVHICIFFILGMLISDGLVGVIHPDRFLLLVSSCLFLAFFVYAHWKMLRLTAYVSMALFFMFAGWTYFSFRYDEIRFSVPVKGDVVVGTVMEYPVRKPHTWAVKIKTQSDTKFIVYLKREESPKIGDTLTVRPLSVNRTCPPDVEDKEYISYMRYLFYSGVSATIYSDSANCIISPSSSFSLSDYANIIRRQLSELYKEGGVIGDEGAVVEAVTTGNKTGLSYSLKDKYSRAGVSHVLALSGYHLSLIYALLELMFLGRFVALRWRWISRLFVLAFLWAFAWLAGMPPSLLRATIMLSVMIVSGIFYRNGLSLNSLAISAIVMLVSDPLCLFDIGFQLSYVSMLGILVVGVPLTGRFYDIHWLADKIVPVVIITMTCSVFTAPLVAYYFGQLPLLSVFTNLILTILVPLILLLAFVWWLSFLIIPVQHYVTSALLSSVHAMNDTVDFIAAIPWATVEWHPNLCGIILFYLLLSSVIGIFYYLCKFKIQTEQ